MNYDSKTFREKYEKAFKYDHLQRGEGKKVQQKIHFPVPTPKTRHEARPMESKPKDEVEY